MHTKNTYQTLILLLAISFLCSFGCAAQTRDWYINPGIKLGYVFGKDGGFNFGIEISVTTTRDNNGHDTYGALISFESFHDKEVAHIGFEVFPNIWYGFSMGPSLVFSSENSDIGIATTIFGGAFILPYYRYTYLPSSPDFHEVGSYLKLLIPLQEEHFSVGG